MVHQKHHKIIATVQARMSSNRLPGKVLKLMNSRPMIGYLIDALRQSQNLDDVILCTSNETSDDALAEYGKREKVEVFRGSLDKVAQRLSQAAKAKNADAIVRICGDSPILDYRIVDQAIEIYRENQVDLVTNVAKRTFPKGQSVEVIKVSALLNMIESGLSTQESEHVTPRFYKDQHHYKLINFEHSPSQGNIQLSVDTQEDFETCNQIISNLEKPHWHYPFTDLLDLHSSILLGRHETV